VEHAEFRGENKFAQRPLRILSVLRVTLFIFCTCWTGVTSFVHLMHRKLPIANAQLPISIFYQLETDSRKLPIGN
jgi:hypothetical protein